MQTKKCQKCEKVKNLDEFNKSVYQENKKTLKRKDCLSVHWAPKLIKTCIKCEFTGEHSLFASKANLCKKCAA